MPHVRRPANRKTAPGAVLGAVAVAIAALAVPAPAASAAPVDVTCTGTETVTYQPGLLLTPRTAQTAVTGILAPCASADADPGITSGNYQEDFSATLSCLTLLAGRSGTRVLHWSNGRTSTFAFNRALNNAGGQTAVTLTGDITAGEFTGDTVLEQVVFVTPSALRCLASPGLGSLGPGPVVLTITGT